MTQSSISEREKPVFSASTILGAIASELSLIKSQDGLTYTDLAATLGKSEDQAAKYCEGRAEMGVIAFARLKREYNGRFTGRLDKLCHDSRPGEINDRACESSVLRAALALSIALSDDNEISAKEVRQNRATLENARDAIDALLGKLTVQAA